MCAAQVYIWHGKPFFERHAEIYSLAMRRKKGEKGK